MEVVTTWHNSPQICHNRCAAHMAQYSDLTNWHAEVTSSMNILSAISGRLSGLPVAWCHASMMSVATSPGN